MIYQFIEKNKIFIRNSVLIILSAETLLYFLFPVPEKIIGFGESVLFGILSGIIMFLVLGFQVRNPVCSKKYLRLGCNFFISFGVFLFIANLISLVWITFHSPSDFQVIGHYTTVTWIWAVYCIKKKWVML